MKKQRFTKFAVVLLVLQYFYHNAQGDIYAHNPRGSNNRLDGTGQNRKNANRLFDSQNNDKGGYNAPESTSKKSTQWFYEKYYMSDESQKKSILTIEWTNQHGCNNEDLNCNIVLQYKCQPTDYSDEANKMRNGKVTKTPPTLKTGIPKYSTKVKTKAKLVRNKKFYNRGLHESFEWYLKCANRERNKGLFTADQALKFDSSKSTRQNPGGTRSGLECPEERDYYPYWHGTEWKDIAVFTDNPDTDCPSYENHSFNREGKGECLEKYKKPEQDHMWNDYSKCNNEACCTGDSKRWVIFHSYHEKNDKTEAECTGTDEIWGLPYDSNFGLLKDEPDDSKECLVQPKPVECLQTGFSRTNHLGNSIDGQPLTYDWVLPQFEETQRCVFRIRYNMTTKDYDTTVDSSSNNDDSVISNDPKIKVKAGDGKTIPLQLALNTAQTGRTFQDRSHIFELIPRENDDCENIYNINVKGKRGNIVQAYPAVEYDFVPKNLTMNKDDCVHFQWAGSNKNPNDAAGEGRAGTDRSNIVAMESPGVNYPLDDTDGTMFKVGTLVRAVGQDVNEPVTQTAADVALYMMSSGRFKSVDELPSQQDLDNDKYDLSKLDSAPASFHGVVMKFPPGIYNFMCTRNNQFSNRNQKGGLTVNE